MTTRGPLEKEIFDRVISALETTGQLLGKMTDIEDKLKEHDVILEGTSTHPGLKSEIHLIKQQAEWVTGIVERIEKKIDAGERQEIEDRRELTHARVTGRFSLGVAIIGAAGLILVAILTTLLTQWLAGGSAKVP